MTSWIFCIIFIQVSIFLLAALLLGISFFTGFKTQAEAAQPARLTQKRALYQQAELTRSELDYLLADDSARF